MNYFTGIAIILLSPIIWSQQTSRQNFHQFNDSVFYAYKNALQDAEITGDPVAISRAHIELATFYKHAQIYTEAVAHYNEALSSVSSPGPKQIAVIKNELAEIYILLKNYSKAIELLQSSLLHSEKEGALSLTAESYQLLGTCWEKQGQPEKALDFQEKSLKLYRSLQNRTGEASVLESIGSIYEDLGAFDKAYSYFEKAYSFFKLENDEAQINALNNIADIYRKTGRYEEAIVKTQEALDLALVYTNPHQIAGAYKDLAKAYALVKNYELAHHFAHTYQQVFEIELYDQNFAQINALQTIYETKEKQAKIDLLQQQNETAQMKFLAMLLLVLAVITTAGIYFYFQKRKRQARLNIELYRQRALEAELETKAAHEQNLQNQIQLKTATLSKYSLSLAQKNKLIEEVSGTLKKLSSRKRMDLPVKLDELSNDLNEHLQEADEWDQFMNLFDEIHPDFTKKLNQAALQNLTATEIRLCLLLRINLSSKEIASILRITPDSVRVARYRLRKKLPLESKDELTDFMLKL